METFRVELIADYPRGDTSTREVEAMLLEQVGPEIDRWYLNHVGAKIVTKVVKEEPRKTTIVSAMSRFSVDIRASMHATTTLTIEAINEHQARDVALEHARKMDMVEFDLDWIDQPSVESVEEVR